jgi:transglutaminase-like putative cysteine protease
MSLAAPPRPTVPGGGEPAVAPRSPAPPRASAVRAAATLRAAEAAATALGVVTVVGYCRVFLGWDFVGPLVIACLASSLLSIGARRMGLNLLVTAVASLAGLAVAVGLLLYRDTTRWGLLPTGVTWDAATADLGAAFEVWNTVQAPVEGAGGFLLIALLAVWFIAFLRDAFAFRAEAGVEALLPDLLLFVVAAALGTDRLRVPVTAAFFGAAALTYLGHRLWRQEALSGWLASRRSNLVLDVFSRAAVVVGVAAVGAALVAPSLPFATGERLIDVTPGSGGGSSRRVALSPFVEIQGRLAGQSQVEVMRVRSEVPSYWRTMALDQFTGAQWRVDAKLRSVEGPLPGRPSVAGREVTQRFAITGLTGLFLPAASIPVQVAAPGDVSYDASLATLVTDGDDVQGLDYAVTSFLPAYSADELRAATGAPSGELAERFLQLPDDFPADLRQQAASIVEGAATPYDQALRLQQYFRENFTYSLSFRAGSDVDAIKEFLAQRQGYCEQFAGTYAAFARAVGLPARVAVGFTPGEQVGSGQYRVLGKHAHAWPEVHLDGIGWVPFEPTPQRGAPGATGWTNVEPQQAGEELADDPSTTPTTAPGDTTGSTTPGMLPDGGLEDFPGIALPTVDTPSSGLPQGDPLWRRALGPLAVIAVLAALWCVAVPTARRIRRDARRRKAGPGAGQVQAAWQEAGDELRAYGLGPTDSETPLEHVARVQSAGGRVAVAEPAMARLADQVTVARYAGRAVEDTTVERARHDAAEVARALHQQRRPVERALRIIDPRDVLGR